MIVSELKDKEKALVKEICHSFPDIVMGLFELDDLPSLEEARVNTSTSFLKYTQTQGRSLEQFYQENEEYPVELALYATNPGRIQSVQKRIRVFKALGIRVVVDFGSGIGVDGVCYAKCGFQVLNVEYFNPSCDVSREAASQWKVENKIKYITPNLFLDYLDRSGVIFPAIQAIEVVAHVPDPYELFAKLMKHTSALLWTNDIGTDHTDTHDPQHLPHNLNKVIKAIESAGGRKEKIEGMAIPPRLYQQKG